MPVSEPSGYSSNVADGMDLPSLGFIDEHIEFGMPESVFWAKALRDHLEYCNDSVKESKKARRFSYVPVLGPMAGTVYYEARDAARYLRNGIKSKIKSSRGQKSEESNEDLYKILADCKRYEKSLLKNCAAKLDTDQKKRLGLLALLAGVTIGSTALYFFLFGPRPEEAEKAIQIFYSAKVNGVEQYNSSSFAGLENYVKDLVSAKDLIAMNVSKTVNNTVDMIGTDIPANSLVGLNEQGNFLIAQLDKLNGTEKIWLDIINKSAAESASAGQSYDISQAAELAKLTAALQPYAEKFQDGAVYHQSNQSGLGFVAIPTEFNMGVEANESGLFAVRNGPSPYVLSRAHALAEPNFLAFAPHAPQKLEIFKNAVPFGIAGNESLKEILKDGMFLAKDGQLQALEIGDILFKPLKGGVEQVANVKNPQGMFVLYNALNHGDPAWTDFKIFDYGEGFPVNLVGKNESAAVDSQAIDVRVYTVIGETLEKIKEWFYDLLHPKTTIEYSSGGGGGGGAAPSGGGAPAPRGGGGLGSGGLGGL